MTKWKSKRILALAMTVVLSLSMAGCGKEKKKDKSEDETTEITVEITTEDIQTPDDTEENTTEVSNVDLNSPEALEEQAEFDEWLWEEFEESVTSDTITLHYTLANPEEYGITPPEVTYGDTDMSDEAIENDIAETKETIAEMEAFDYQLLTDDQKFTYDILYNSVNTDLEFYDYLYLYEPFAYTSGLHTNLPITLSNYIFYDKGDVDDYLSLLQQAPDYFQVYLDFEVTKSKKGLFMSSNSANEVIRQCTEYIANPEENLLIVTFNDRIGDVEGLTAEEIESYKQANYDAVMNCIIPTYENVINTFNRLKTTGKNDLGLCHLENGQEYYRYLIKDKVGTDKTPEEIIETLDDAISDIMTEYSSVAMGNYEAYMDYTEDYGNLYEENDPKETIVYFSDAFDQSFPEIPDIQFTVDPVHESLEDIVSPAYYMTPAMDDYENNSIYINHGSEGSNSLWSTLAHEGYPGHMYQFVYFLSNDPEPIRTILNFNGYCEGWATYIEGMSYAYYDGYKHDCYADLERINNNLNLLVSARVEIGVNYEGWDLTATKEYLGDNGFDPSVAQDIMNYVIAEPANYQMYCTGWLEFEELRDKAEEALGDSFDEIAFHKTLLDAGPCQFYLLEEKVNEYINSAK